MTAPSPVAAEIAERPGWKRDTAVFLSGRTVSLFAAMLVQYAVMWHLTLLTQSGTVLAISSVVGFLPLVGAGVALFGVVGVAVALPSGRRSIAAAGVHAA